MKQLDVKHDIKFVFDYGLKRNPNNKGYIPFYNHCQKFYERIINCKTRMNKIPKTRTIKKNNKNPNSHLF